MNTPLVVVKADELVTYRNNDYFLSGLTSFTPDRESSTVSTEDIKWIVDTFSVNDVGEPVAVTVVVTPEGHLIDVRLDGISCGYYTVKTIINCVPGEPFKHPELISYGALDTHKLPRDNYILPMFGGMET